MRLFFPAGIGREMRTKCSSHNVSQDWEHLIVLFLAQLGPQMCSEQLWPIINLPWKALYAEPTQAELAVSMTYTGAPNTSASTWEGHRGCTVLSYSSE